jgi:Transcription factor WhiB
VTVGWWTQAACAGAPPSWFIGLGPGPLARGLAVCEQCPVRAPCRAWAETLPKPNGHSVVLGGMVVTGYSSGRRAGPGGTSASAT